MESCAHAINGFWFNFGPAGWTRADPYLYVITAQTTDLFDRETLATLQIEQMVAAISLIEALAGAGDRSQLPTASQVSKKPPLGTTSCSTSGVAGFSAAVGEKGIRLSGTTTRWLSRNTLVGGCSAADTLQ